jgi:parallel beta-helix repeat protein
MKAWTLSLTTVLALCLSIGIPLARGDFYVVPVARGVGTPISSVPYTISEPGLYYLTKNLAYSGTTGAAITVEANDVTIDLMGFALSGAGASSGTNYGIYMNGRRNVEIRNGTVRDFGYHGIGETAVAGKDHVVINIRAISNGWDGIRLNGYGNLVQGCTASENGAYAVGSAWGAGIGVGDGSSIIDNTVYHNIHSGIFVGTGCTVNRNTAYNNQMDGIELGVGSTLTGNTARGNQSTGFSGKLGCTMNGNTASWNGGSGFYVPAGSTAIGNAAYYNSHYGFHFLGNNLVDQNNAFENNQSGGAYTNFSACSSCTLGTNHAP